jgi:hypothetical protein
MLKSTNSNLIRLASTSTNLYIPSMLKNPSTKYKFSFFFNIFFFSLQQYYHIILIISIIFNRAFPSVNLPNRTWPDARITKAPRWASSDLRDGNQALVNPMSIEQKDIFFKLLLKCGFKEIEAGFPSASETEFGFIRGLIEKDQFPDDVWLQVESFHSLYN